MGLKEFDLQPPQILAMEQRKKIKIKTIKIPRKLIAKKSKFIKFDHKVCNIEILP